MRASDRAYATLLDEIQSGALRPGTVLGEVRQQRGIRIAEHDPVAGRGEGVRDAAPGAQRDVALVRDAAGEDDEVERRCSGVGFSHDLVFLHFDR